MSAYVMGYTEELKHLLKISNFIDFKIGHFKMTLQ